MPSPDPKCVFIVYGRNSGAHEALKLFLGVLKLNALDFDEVKNDLGGSQYVGNVVRAGMDRAQAVIVLFTPDEYTALRPGLSNDNDSESDKEHWQPRSNVIFEAGMAWALGQSRTILVILGNVPLPSDLQGILFIRLNNSPAARERLRDALVGARCDAGKYTSGLNNSTIAGDFESCLKPPALPEVKPLSPFRG